MSKTQNEFICFVTPGQPTTYEEYADFENLSTSEILLKLDNSSNLCLRTPFFIKPLQHDSKPLQEYKDLKIVEKLKQYERPPKFLTFDNDLNFISILVTPKAIKCHHIIPPFFVKFFIDEIPNKTSEFVKNEILLKIGFKVNSATIHFDSNSISDDENAESIIEKAQNQKLYIDLVLPDLSISRLRKRVNILGEILSTEKTYINDLTLIIEKWQSGLEKFFEPEDFQTIFKDIAVIKSCHERFLNDFEKSGTTYDSQVSVPFIEFAPFFKVSQQYIANYTEISEILNKYDKNKKFIRTMNAISENINGRDLRSYLITPVQRMPRYVLFLRDLIKSTPLSHPDAEFLRVAFSDIDEITKKIDKAASIAKKQQELMKLQKGINNFVFLDKQRSLLFQCPLTVNGQKKGDVYLFEDLIIFIQGNSKVIFDSGIQIFPYRPFWPDELSITLDTSDKKYVSEKSYFVTFLNPEDKKAFFDEVAKMQQKLQFRCGPNHLLLEWETPDIQKTMPLITQPSVTLYDDSLMITSAAKKEVFLYRLVLSNGYLFQTVDVKFPVFKLPNVVLSRHNIMYIINNGNLLKFDPRTNKVTQLSVTFTPRYGHSACFWHDSILIFGGKSIQTHQLLNDLIIYNTTKNTMITVGPNETSPPPRWQHCSFVDYDKLYVFSGETVDGITNDMYCYDLDKSEWSPCETIEGLLPRKGGKSIITNHFTVFLGGTEGNKPQIYSLKKRVLLEIENYGNLPNALENFDAIFGEDGSIIIITETNLYRVTTPAVLKKSSSMNKLKASEIDGNDSFMTRRNKIRNRAKKERLKAAGGSLRKKKPQRAISQALFNIEPDNEENPLNDDEILLYGDDEFFDEYGTPRKSPIAKIPGSSQRGSPRSPVRSPTRSGRSPLPIPNSHTRFRSLNLSDEEDEDELSSSSTPSRKRYEHTQLSISPTSQSTERAEETQESSQSVSPLNLGSINDNQGKIDDSIIEEILVEEVVEEEIVQHHVAELEPELQLSPRGYNKIKAKLNLNENLIVEVEPTGNISFLQILATATISAAVTTGAFLLYLRRHRT